MVVPGLGNHLHRNQQAESASHNGRGCTLGAEQLFKLVAEPQDSKADPDSEGVEGSRIGVVPLSWLIRRLVEVKHYCYSRKEEKQERYQSVSLVVTKLVQKTYYSQYQRQKVEMVLGSAADDVCRAFRLVAKAGLVYEADAALPVALVDVARNCSVKVVLPSCKVPQEISPVHEVHLVAEEILEVGAKRRSLVRPVAYTLGINLVEPVIRRVCIRPHSREEHLVSVRGLCRTVQFHVLSGIVVKVVVVRRVDRFHVRLVSLAVEQRRGTVLLTVKISDQGIRVVRLVLVCWSVHR